MKVQTLLPLETFREYMGFNPWHFWGFRDSNLLTVSSACNPVLLERQSQGFDRAGRNDIRQALAQAERKIAGYIKFWPAPKYFSETLEWPRVADSRMVRGAAAQPDWRWLNIEVSNGWVQAVGTRLLTALATNTSVTYYDEDGDGYFDVALIGPITVPAGTRVQDVALYYSAADRFGMNPTLSDEEWRIEPITPVLSGTSLTIRVPPWIMARPILYEGVNPQPLEPTLTNLASTVDVYSRTTYGGGTTTDTSQATIIWETRPTHAWWCVCASCGSSTAFGGSPDDPAAIAQAIARVGIRDSEKGLVTPAEAVYDATTGTWAATSAVWCEEPDRVTIRYLAGYPADSFGHMDPNMIEIVTYLAAAELWRPVCGCDAANRALDYLQLDLAKIGNDKELYQVSDRVVRNLFGTRRGHVMAYQRLDMVGTWSGFTA